MTHEHRTSSVVRSSFEKRDLPAATFFGGRTEEDDRAGDAVCNEGVSER